MKRILFNTLWLDVAGLACIATAGYVAHLIAGLVLTGLACIALGWRLDQ